MYININLVVILLMIYFGKSELSPNNNIYVLVLVKSIPSFQEALVKEYILEVQTSWKKAAWFVACVERGTIIVVLCEIHSVNINGLF